jgi:molecular chaperone Hsp33
MSDSSPRADRWVKCIAERGNIRGMAIEATGLVSELAGLHGLKGVSSRGLGEAVMAALTVASYCKAGERVNLNVLGSGFFRQALVDAAPDGTVRGYLVERDPSKATFGQDAQSGPWGTGTLSVLRSKEMDRQQPYIGTVPLLTGHLAKDLTYYWVQSEQINSAVGLAVNLGSGGEVVLAGGFLVQALPGASVDEVARIERHIEEIDSLADDLARDPSPVSLLSQIFQSTGFMIVEERLLELKCNCSWDRVWRALTLVGPVELEMMLAEDESAIVRCDFCTREYKVDADGLRRLIESTGGAKRDS